MIHNLAGSPEHQETLERMRCVLRRWVLETHDTGFLHQAEMHRRAGNSTVYEMARDPARYPMDRILNAADLVGRGIDARDRMIPLLGDPDAAVRYWGAVALGTLDSHARPAADKLMARLHDPSPNVRLAAAEALCQAGHSAQGLPVLAAGLAHEDGWVRLHAANALQYLGPTARPVLPQIKQAIEDSGSGQAALYIRWGLSHAVDKLEPR
jgi:hypothetical protein